MHVRKPTRPIYLNLFAFSFPITAIVSILHRISGIVLFCLIPVGIWGLQLSLKSAKDFSSIKSYFSHDCYKWLIYAGLAALFYHIIAGIRHLIMDFGFGETKEVARISACLVLIAAAMLVLLYIMLV